MTRRASKCAGGDRAKSGRDMLSSCVPSAKPAQDTTYRPGYWFAMGILSSPSGRPRVAGDRFHELIGNGSPGHVGARHPGLEERQTRSPGSREVTATELSANAFCVSTETPYPRDDGARRRKSRARGGGRRRGIGGG